MGIAFLLLTTVHQKGFASELTLYTTSAACIWPQLRHKHTWSLLGFVDQEFWHQLWKFLPWEACDPSESPKVARQREMVLPDLERGLLGPQRWTSCGEENILSWIKDVFVYQGGCAAPRGRGMRIQRKEDGKRNSLCNIHWMCKEAWKWQRVVGKGWISNLTWVEECSKLDLSHSYLRFFFLAGAGECFAHQIQLQI